MKWRFIDRIDSWQPWQRLAGRKVVSLEEYCLGEPLGRRGVFPETLLLETAVEGCRWLVLASSEFVQSCSLAEVREFSVLQPVGMGAVLELTVALAPPPEAGYVTAVCELGTAAAGLVARGTLRLQLAAAAAHLATEDMRTLWQNLLVVARPTASG